MKAFRPIVAALALLVALAGLTAVGAPAQAAGLPGVRTFAVASQVDHAAKVVWTAPDTTRAVKRYRIAWGDHATVLAPSARSYVVQGLANGVAVTVRIRPVYGAGVWGARRTVQAMGAARPATPIAPSVARTETAGGRTTVAVAWTAVAANGPAPVQYRLHRTGPSGSTVVCDWTTATSCSNTVANDGTYTFQVRARNAEATSPRAEGHRLDYVTPLGAGTSVNTAPPPPTVVAAKGAAVSAGSGCSGSCWYVMADGNDFPSPATCSLRNADTNGQIGSTWSQSNSWIQTSNWVGSGVPFYLSCANGAHSRTYTF